MISVERPTVILLSLRVVFVSFVVAAIVNTSGNSCTASVAA